MSKFYIPPYFLANNISAVAKQRLPKSPKKRLSHGKFHFAENNSQISREGNTQTDYFEEDGLTLTSSVEWLSESEYKLTLIDIDEPQKVDYNIGDELYVKVITMNKDYYSAESTYKGKTQRSVFWFE